MLEIYIKEILILLYTVLVLFSNFFLFTINKSKLSKILNFKKYQKLQKIYSSKFEVLYFYNFFNIKGEIKFQEEKTFQDKILKKKIKSLNSSVYLKLLEKQFA